MMIDPAWSPPTPAQQEAERIRKLNDKMQAAHNRKHAKVRNQRKKKMRAARRARARNR